MSAEPELSRSEPVAEARRVAAPAPGRPEPVTEEPAGARWRIVPGFLVLVGCLEAGEWLKVRGGLALPGNIVGLFLLLGLLALGVVPLRWVEGAARRLLFLLPFLFLPVFILAMRDRAFWAVQGKALAGAVVLGTVLLWAVVGHLSQSLLRKAEGERSGGAAGDATQRRKGGRDSQRREERRREKGGDGEGLPR